MTHASLTPIIDVKNLSKSFGDHPVLDQVNVTIHMGDLVSVIGPSGCGKSTLLRCLNCLEVLDSGRIQIDNLVLERTGLNQKLGASFEKTAHDIRERVGMVFQQFNLFPHKTLLENVMLAPMVVKKMTHNEAEAIALKQLGRVGLVKFKDRYPTNLSGGQKQRGAIARALAMNPKVMLYDEPTSSLDPELVDEVLQVMRDLDAEGMTQIVVTHEMPFARDASDYIIFMEHGKIVEISDEDEIFLNPQDPRTKQFLARYNR